MFAHYPMLSAVNCGQKNPPQCTFCPLGDSITSGQTNVPPFPTDYRYSWRTWVSRLLVDTPGMPVVRFIGPTPGYNWGPQADNLCWADGGYGITTFQTGLGNAGGSIFDQFGVGKPLHGVDLIGWMIGTNDAAGGAAVNQTNYLNTLRSLHTLEPQARFFLSSPPQTKNAEPARQTSLATFVAALPGLWATLAGEGLIIFTADAWTILNPTTDLRDNLHPSVPSGCNILANGFWPSLKSAIIASAH